MPSGRSRSTTGVVAVVEEQADAEAEVLRHQRPLDVEPAGGAGGGHEALPVEAVGARQAGGGEAHEERGDEGPACASHEAQGATTICPRERARLGEHSAPGTDTVPLRKPIYMRQTQVA